jgi:plasmid stabilization system protein ParE
MSDRASVHVTRNFERNLEDIRAFLEEGEAPQVFERLLDLLFDAVIPNLEQFPRMGIDFFARRPRSIEGAAKVMAIGMRLGAETRIREYIVDDYIVLYAEREGRVDLLAIKHHRQLSFDLRGHWSP